MKNETNVIHDFIIAYDVNICNIFIHNFVHNLFTFY